MSKAWTFQNPTPSRSSSAPTLDIYLVQPKFPTSYLGMEYFIALTPYAVSTPSLLLVAGARVEPVMPFLSGSAGANELLRRNGKVD